MKMEKFFVVVAINSADQMEALKPVLKAQNISFWRASYSEILRNLKLAVQNPNVLLPDLIVLTAPCSGGAWANCLRCLGEIKKFQIPVVVLTVMSPKDPRYVKLLEYTALICHCPFEPEVLGRALAEKLQTVMSPAKE